jgi:hypothetical protein
MLIFEDLNFEASQFPFYAHSISVEKSCIILQQNFDKILTLTGNNTNLCND